MAVEVLDSKETEKIEDRETTEVVAFRLRGSQIRDLQTATDSLRIVGVHSVDQFSRWVIEQYLTGRLILIKPMSSAPSKR